MFYIVFKIINIKKGGVKVRFSVNYQVEILPIHYRMIVYSLIKEAVRISDQNYYEKWFIQREREIKPFSFSTYLVDFEITGNTINLKEITITISADMEFAIHAINGLKRLKIYETGGVTWKQTNIRLLKEVVITSNTALFQTLSPILVENIQGEPLAPEDENYEKELNYFANLQVQQVAHRDLFEPIRFTPIRMTKQVIKESNRVFKETHKDGSLFFTTYKGLFKVEGHPEDLQILYQYGFGKRTTYFGLTEYKGEVK